MAGLRRGIVPAWWLHHPAVGADGFCLLAALSLYADPDGACYPSQATLARHLGRSRPWVNKVLGELAKAGLLVKSTRTRGDGGQTSCLYRLRLDPVPDMTGAWHEADTPRHRDDTSQDQSNQNRHTPAAPADAPAGAAAKTCRDDREATALEAVPDGWQPGEREVSEALRICPGADLDRHTVRFVGRCRSKGYRFVAGAVGDAWLSWLVDDAKREVPGASPARPASRGPVDRGTLSRDRMSAWARAATIPGHVPAAADSLR